MTASDSAFAEITDEVVLASYPRVRLDHLNKHFYRGLLTHRLLAGHCADCNRWHTPLRPRCPQCWSESVEPRPVGGRCTVYLLTLLHQGPPSRDVDYSTPWPFAAVELVEQPGLRVTATIVECPPERLRVGLPVELLDAVESWPDGLRGTLDALVRPLAEQAETTHYVGLLARLHADHARDEQLVQLGSATQASLPPARWPTTNDPSVTPVGMRATSRT